MRPPLDQNPGIRDAMVFIAGIALGIWLFVDDLKKLPSREFGLWVQCYIAMLGGMSMSGCVLLTIDRFQYRRHWRAPVLAWFAIGLTAWSLAPAITILKIKEAAKQSWKVGDLAPACFIYTLPLMGMFLFVATLVGGRARREWWACRGWWPEWLSMWCLAGWSLAGIYVLKVVYLGD